MFVVPALGSIEKGRLDFISVIIISLALRVTVVFVFVAVLFYDWCERVLGIMTHSLCVCHWAITATIDGVLHI